MSFRPPKVYPLTAADRSHAPQVEHLLREGYRLLQVRDRGTPDGALLEELDRAVEMAVGHGSLLLVNDRPDLALLSGAGGAHLGEDDLPLDEARRLLGPASVLGRSSHDEASARDAEDAGADYVAFGPIYATGSKADAGAPTGLEALRRVRDAVRLPLVAIGGITLDRAAEVLDAGADSVAVIRDLEGSGRAARWLREVEGLPPASRGLLFLTGFMGSGKTRVGGELARHLGRRFVDLDGVVEARCGMSVADLFESRGQEAFREAEAAALESIPRGADAVVALGGGALMRGASLDRVRQLGTLAWLDCPLEETLRRCADGGGRPLLGSHTEARRALAARIGGYRRAHLRVDATGTPEAIASRILSYLEDRERARDTARADER
jgi:thiamine-phosphate pyrophosphorylase